MKQELPKCPVEITMKFIGDRTKIMIVGYLQLGPLRTSALLKKLGDISKTTLTKHLRELEKDCIIKRKVYSEVPVKVEYSLSEIGCSMKPIIDELAKWGEQYKAKPQD